MSDHSQSKPTRVGTFADTDGRTRLTVAENEAVGSFDDADAIIHRPASGPRELAGPASRTRRIGTFADCARERTRIETSSAPIGSFADEDDSGDDER